MNLTEELKAKKEASAKAIPEGKWKIMLQSTQDLIKSNIAEKAVKKGDKMPNFSLPNALGTNFTLSDQLAKGNVIVSFYRGGWCPYCNLELRALQNLLPEFKKAGASLVAISPETPDNSLSTSEKNNLEFDVLSDLDNSLAKKFGLVFQLPEELRSVYHSFNIDVPKHNGDTKYELPMPATYVVNQNYEVIFSFIPEDYTERADPNDILKAITQN